MPLQTIALALCALLQDSSANPAPDAVVPKKKSEWVTVDKVVMIVDLDIITQRQLVKDYARYDRDNPTRNASERRYLESKVLADRVKQRLAVRGGQDMGVDEKLIEQRVTDNFVRRIETQNGVVGMSKLLQANDLSTQEARRKIRDDIYSKLWRDSVTGEGAGNGARTLHDTFVRPGMLTYQYQKLIQTPSSFDLIGGKPELITVQTLPIDIEGAGGIDAARALALQLKQRIEDGEDMGVLVDRFTSSTENKGVSEPIDPRRLASIDAAVAAFVSRAKLGDVSDVLPPVRTDRRQYLRIVRLVDRTPPVRPDLLDAAVQKTISENVTSNLQAYRLDRALGKLLNAAYVWPKELAGR